MFSEYFDIKKGDILRGLDEKITDEFSDEKQSDKNSEVLQPSKEDNKITKILETHINSRTGEYWSFFNNFPNAFHVDTSGRSIGKDIYEVGESEIGGITEKKIKGFDKTFEDGKSVEVREDNGDILFSFLDEGKNNKTTIILSNFQNFGKTPKSGETLAAPNISITGDTSVLPDSIQKHTNNINGNIDFSKDNAKIFKEIFDSIDQNIMRPKIEEFHGYVDNVKKNTEDLFFKISTENIDEIDVLNSLRGNNFIDSLIKDYNYDNFTIEDYSDLMSRKIALSLCLLLRNSSKTEIKNSIKKILGYDEDSGVEQKDKLNKDENSIEFIPVDEFFIANGDVLISLAVEFVKNNPSMKNAEEIIKILTS